MTVLLKLFAYAAEHKKIPEWRCVQTLPQCKYITGIIRNMIAASEHEVKTENVDLDRKVRSVQRKNLTRFATLGTFALL